MAQFGYFLHVMQNTAVGPITFQRDSLQKSIPQLLIPRLAPIYPLPPSSNYQQLPANQY